MKTVAGTDVPATMLQRLALAVVLQDHATGQPALGRPMVAAELLDRRQDGNTDREPRLELLEAGGGPRFKVRYQLTDALPDRPRTLRLRVTDPDGRYVPRRVEQLVRPQQRVLDAEDPPPDSPPVEAIPVQRRLVELRLFPGPAYPLAGGATALRGQVVRGSQPVPWPRVGLAQSSNPATELGWTHGDGEGQFQIPLNRVGSLGRLTGPFTLTVHAPPPPPAPGRLAPGDRLDPLRTLEIVPLPDLVDPPRSATPSSPPSRGQYLPQGAQQHLVVLNDDIEPGRIRTETITIT